MEGQVWSERDKEESMEELVAAATRWERVIQHDSDIAIKQSRVTREK